MILERATVVGLGLIGGSLGAALRDAGVRVRGFDVDPSASSTAERRGLIDERSDDLGAAVAGADAVVLCTPVSATLELLPNVDRLTPLSAIILDAGSVKVPVVERLETLPGAARAVGGHPLAGKETSGPEAAEPGLFRGRSFILAPSSRTTSPTLRRASELVSILGAIPRVMPANTHDAVLARTSHLPQLLATVLALDVREDDRPYIGPGLRDMTRLAGSDPVMWRDILLFNSANVVDEANIYIARLQEIVAAVQAGDAQQVEHVLAAGQRAGRALRGAAA